jgi:nicotinamide mononucleotide transporter
MASTFDYFVQLPLLELTAMLMALIYVVLATKGNIWCWPAAFVSTVLYTTIFYDVYLWMDSLLQIYYMIMAVYGWYCWQQSEVSGGPITTAASTLADDKHGKTHSSTLKITTWSFHTHLLIIGALSLISALVGWLMASFTPAHFPYYDAATTVFAIFATYMVTKKVLENWLYWCVIDVASIYIYLEKGLTSTAVLFGLYVILATYGYYNWRKVYHGEQLILAASP